MMNKTDKDVTEAVLMALNSYDVFWNCLDPINPKIMIDTFKPDFENNKFIIHVWHESRKHEYEVVIKRTY